MRRHSRRATVADLRTFFFVFALRAHEQQQYHTHGRSHRENGIRNWATIWSEFGPFLRIKPRIGYHFRRPSTLAGAKVYLWPSLEGHSRWAVLSSRMVIETHKCESERERTRSFWFRLFTIVYGHRGETLYKRRVDYGAFLLPHESWHAAHVTEQRRRRTHPRCT